VILHSQIPVGTADHIRRTLEKAGRRDLLLAVTPENLRLGRALQDFEQPGFLTVGVRDPRAAEAATAFWAPAEAEIAVVDPATAELAKHVINAMLATSTALGNEVAGVADRSGADGMAAARLARRDPRLAMLPILPGLPFSGGTLARDLGVLADSAGQESLFAAVRRSNRARMDRLVDRIESAGGPVCFLGLTYKPGTSTLRRSMALALALAVANRGLAVRAHDPHIDPEDSALTDAVGVSVLPLDGALDGATTVVMTTAHPEFKALRPTDFRRKGARTVLDLVGCLDAELDWSGIELLGP
jgi:UDPglucose 6-dehydrogenase